MSCATSPARAGRRDARRHRLRREPCGPKTPPFRGRRAPPRRVGGHRDGPMFRGRDRLRPARWTAI